MPCTVVVELEVRSADEWAEEVSVRGSQSLPPYSTHLKTVAGCFDSPNTPRPLTLPVQCSVLRAQLAAILIALRDIPATEGITLLTDSQTTIYLIRAMLTKPQSLLRHKHRWLLSKLVQTLYSRSAPTAIHKVHGHTGSFGNTVADELANTAHTDPAPVPYVSAPSPGRGVFWPQSLPPPHQPPA